MLYNIITTINLRRNIMRKTRKYTKKFKDSVLKKLEEPTNDTITSLSKELNVPKTTIYQWKKKKDKSSNNYKSVSKWSSEDKYQAVLETSSLSELEIAKYCRRKGIHVNELKTWEKQCLNANSSNQIDPEELKNTLKQEKNKNKTLQKELRIKEKALAETAALLVLRKKANAIWGDPEVE